MVRVCSISVRRRRQTEGDRSSPPAADKGRRVWGWLQSGASASLHLSGAQATSPSPSSSCTRSSGEAAAGASPSRRGKAEGRRGSIPRQPWWSRSFPSSKQQSPPPQPPPARPPCSHLVPLLEPLYAGGSRGYHYYPSSQPTIWIATW
jgi:hypothetical protein